MNLLTATWLPLRLTDSTIHTLPVQAITRPDVLDVAMPRMDFQNAAYQMLIGILQTLYAPQSIIEWEDRFRNPPNSETFQKALNQGAHAFQVIGDAPLFMQDFEPLNEAKDTPVSGLLIDEPGGNTLKENKDIFIKRDGIDSLSLPMAAMALFTLQINAPSGGQGHRTGLRGGGPMTTLLLPEQDDACLWQKLWLNVIHQEFLGYPDPDLHSHKVFPWLAETKGSKGKNTGIFAEDVHPLTMYWAMPRRIRLMVEDQSSICSISGIKSPTTVSHYRTQNYGNNYEGAWIHPLTPYRFNPKKPTELPWSVKGQPEGITYKLWDTLTLDMDDENGKQAATVMAHMDNIYWDLQPPIQPRGIRAFAFDMDNMKARGLHQHEMPLFYIAKSHREAFIHTIRSMQELASEAISMTRKKVKEAWFIRASEVKGNVDVVAAAFWQRSEAAFFDAVGNITQQEKNLLTPETGKKWLRAIQTTCLSLFDEYVLNDHDAPADSWRFFKNRRELSGWLHGSKSIKRFHTEFQLDQETSHD